jgi:hypothetical protein
MSKRILVPGCLLILTVLVFFASSCGSSDYRIFSLKEGIGHFTMEYPPEYAVVRIDIRNDSTNRYTDIGLRPPQSENINGLNEISIYAWPVDPAQAGAVFILDDLLSRADSIFNDFEVLQRYSRMIGDMEGQVAIFSWTASANESTTDNLPVISRMVCFFHGDLAWEIHVASDLLTQDQAEAEFNHILETFQILN